MVRFLAGMLQPFVLCILALPSLSALVESYLGSGRCVACHQAADAAWKGSDHANAWTEAKPANIRASFDGTEFTLVT